MSLRVEWIDDPERFAALAPAWDALACAAPAPFTRHAWLRAWWRAFGEGRRLAVCVAWEGDALAAGLALCREGEQLESLANAHVPWFAAVGDDPAALRVLLAAALAGTGDKLVLRAVALDDPIVGLLRAPAVRRGRPLVMAPTHRSPVVETGGDREAYRAERKRHLGKLAAAQRRMAREHALDLRAAEPPRDLGAELAEGFALEASGWKGRTGTAIAQADATRGFYEEVARAFAASGELRLSRLALDGRPVAFDLAVVHAGRLWGLKAGYDEAFRRFSPGLVLRAAVIERCFAEGLAAYELLGEAEEWKRKFATTERPHATVVAYALRPLPLLRFAYRSLRQRSAAPAAGD